MKRGALVLAGLAAGLAVYLAVDGDLGRTPEPAASGGAAKSTPGVKEVVPDEDRVALRQVLADIDRKLGEQGLPDDLKACSDAIRQRGPGALPALFEVFDDDAAAGLRVAAIHALMAVRGPAIGWKPAHAAAL